MKKSILVSALGLALAFSASAHVAVKPSSVGLASRQVFTVSVPSEKNIPTTGLRIVLPEGITSVTATVKPGWKIEVKQVSTGKQITEEDGDVHDEMVASEIIWSGGSIPGGQRDEFTFSTQVPSTATNLNWKAYQTYSDGSVVSWDQTPGGDAKNPYSTTAVVDDLKTEPAPSDNSTRSAKENGALILSVVALALAVVALTRKQ